MCGCADGPSLVPAPHAKVGRHMVNCFSRHLQPGFRRDHRQPERQNDSLWPAVEARRPSPGRPRLIIRKDRGQGQTTKATRISAQIQSRGIRDSRGKGSRLGWVLCRRMRFEASVCACAIPKPFALLLKIAPLRSIRLNTSREIQGLFNPALGRAVLRLRLCCVFCGRGQAPLDPKWCVVTALVPTLA